MSKGDKVISGYLIITLLVFGFCFNKMSTVETKKDFLASGKVLTFSFVAGTFWPLYLPIVLFEKG